MGCVQSNKSVEKDKVYKRTDNNLKPATMENNASIMQVIEVCESVAETAKQVIESNKPVAETVKPVAETVKPKPEEKKKEVKTG